MADSEKEKKEPGSNRKWGYASYYDDKETGEMRLIYTSIENSGKVNRYTDNGDGGHGHSKWDKKEDYDAGKDSDWKRLESNDSDNPTTGEIQDKGGCYLTTACMYQYKNQFDDNCHELTVLRWFRDKFVSLPDKYRYYKIAPSIVEGLNHNKNKEKYYNYIYEHVVKACAEAIERGDYKFAYNRYKRTIQFLENEFVAIQDYNQNINLKPSNEIETLKEIDN